MTNEQIITTIAVALISFLSKSIFDKILAPYIPERKKLNSYIKKTFFFSLEYIFPLSVIVYLMIVTNTIDKYFVLSMVVNSVALSNNFLTGLSISHSQTMLKHMSITQSQTDVINAMGKDLNDHAEVLKQIIDKLLLIDNSKK